MGEIHTSTPAKMTGIGQYACDVFHKRLPSFVQQDVSRSSLIIVVLQARERMMIVMQNASRPRTKAAKPGYQRFRAAWYCVVPRNL
jgi:hypothetical protein